MMPLALLSLANFFFKTMKCVLLYWSRQLAVPFSRGSSQSRDQTQVSRVAGGFLNF